MHADEAAGDFLQSPALGADATLDASPLIEGPGTKIGRYELLEQIGEGGMGLVYLAQQKQPVKRLVALKIVKPGMDSRAVIARFEAERQALALLDHPNIAHVLDAGTTDTGRPYFIMEYVKGMSITRYCDDRKLSIEQRLRLFKQLCEGLHYAHQKGIIHRDIKPSNILVSVHGDRAVPKIIDFGIAKATASALTDKTMFTLQGQLMGTPEYMSPEQVDLATQDIDTRSDIYSLGVLLYELLTGVLPFDSKSFRNSGFAEIQRTIREQEPATPSTRLTDLGQEAQAIAESRRTQIITLARCLHRELEWIPMKAMRKDRVRRYRSASEFADDIQNYLNGSALIAGPETALYKAQKFVRRHAGSVATVALVAVAIILGLIGTTTMYVRAERALDREVQARAQSEEAREKETAARTQAEQAEKVAEEQRSLAEERAEDYRRSLYVNHIALANVAYHSGNMDRFRELLDLCPEDLRGWEWNRLTHLQDPALMTFQGHESRVNSVSFSPDGKWIVSGSADKTIKVWDAATGVELKTLRGHEHHVVCAAFSPDGRRIVSGSSTVKVWDVATGGELMSLRGHERLVWDVSFSPDGRRIVSGGHNGMVKVWDAGTGAELMTLAGHEGLVRSVGFSPDGKRITSASGDGTIRVWDAESGDELMSLSGRQRLPVGGSFGPHGKRIVSGGADKAIRVWDAASGAELMTLHGHEGDVLSVVFSPDGRRIISGCTDNTIRVWDSVTGVEEMTLRGHGGSIMSVAFSPDGQRIISGSDDKTIKLWDTVIHPKLTTLPLPRRLDGVVDSLAFSPDGKRIIAGSSAKTIKVWDIASATETMTLCGHGDSVHAPWSPVQSVAFSPDGKRIVSGSSDKTIKLWDMATGAELVTLRGHQNVVHSVVFTPDGRHIISGSTDKMIKIWDAATGDELMALAAQEGGIHSIAISQDGKRIVSGDDGNTIKVWDAENGTEVLTLRGHESAVLSVALSSDGKFVVSGSHDRTIKLWDVKSGTQLMTLRGHNGQVGCVAFSPDGKRIASSGRETFKLWDAATGAELMALPDSGRVIAFSPNGKTIAIGTGTGVRLLESETPADGYGPRRTGAAAQSVVSALHKEHQLYSKVIAAIKADDTLDASVRELALQIANARLWEDAEKQ
jgi:eukaryotic-like serine/threonine-protein kinase